MVVYLNKKKVQRYVGRHWAAVNYWSDNHLRDFTCLSDRIFSCGENADGSPGGFRQTPTHYDGKSCISVAHRETHSSPMTLRRMIPVELLFGKDVEEYSLYWVRFMTTGDLLDTTLRSVLNAGYIGVTKRPPLERFKEHRRDADRQGGHLLHNVWSSLTRSGITFVPDFTLIRTAKTQVEIYDLEETYVAKYSLNPRGLNAIPGGMAGIRMLHQLGLCAHRNVGIDERDRAIARLASGKKAAHFRAGHIRKLPTEKITWVSPCWVNMETPL